MLGESVMLYVVGCWSVVGGFAFWLWLFSLFSLVVIYAKKVGTRRNISSLFLCTVVGLPAISFRPQPHKTQAHQASTQTK